MTSSHSTSQSEERGCLIDLSNEDDDMHVDAAAAAPLPRCRAYMIRSAADLRGAKKKRLPAACTVCLCDLEDELILSDDVLLEAGWDAKEDIQVAITCPRGHPIHASCLVHARRSALADGKSAFVCPGSCGAPCGLPFSMAAQRFGATGDEIKRLDDTALQAVLGDSAIACPWPGCGNHIFKQDIGELRPGGAGSSSSSGAPPKKRLRAAENAQPSEGCVHEVECPACRRTFCSSCRQFPAHKQISVCTDVASKRQEWEDAVIIADSRHAEPSVQTAALERYAEKVRLRITDHILSTRCPDCARAFLDFDGCFALYCHCGAGFCGWCLQSCKADPHDHVRQCPEGTGMFFGTTGAFQAAQNKIRGVKLRALFEELPTDEVREAVAKAIQADLRSVGMNVKDYYAVHHTITGPMPQTWKERVLRLWRTCSCANRAVPKAAPKRKAAVAKKHAESSREPCSRCQSTEYDVQWKCACCVDPAWHACGTCVDMTGRRASCTFEGHWLLRVRDATKDEVKFKGGSWVCQGCSVRNAAHWQRCISCRLLRAKDVQIDAA
eukprot:TRINITY_DN74902_c0_g1_i1.p1 TRINITY_DN74902_c0_g1~~TRINITY_DN74902_c0_g1_i1.p1  ORF type:complete len:553 (-),score=68.17 TRINITY_DN74902_c0_g1_i1:123-1781(-)